MGFNFFVKVQKIVFFSDEISYQILPNKRKRFFGESIKAMLGLIIVFVKQTREAHFCESIRNFGWVKIRLVFLRKNKKFWLGRKSRLSW